MGLKQMPQPRLFSLYRVRRSVVAGALLAVPFFFGLLIFGDVSLADVAFWRPLGVGYLAGFLWVFLGSWALERKVHERTPLLLLGLVAYVAFVQAIFLAAQSDVGTDAFADFVVLTMGVGATFGVVTVTHFWTWWWPAFPRPRKSAARVVGETAIAVVMLTLAFAALTAVLEARGPVDTKPNVEDNPIWTMENYYAREFWAAVPELEIPKSVNWHRPFRGTNALSGLLLVGFKLLVILPIVAAIADLWRQRKEDSSGIGSGQAEREGDAASFEAVPGPPRQ